MHYEDILTYAEKVESVGSFLFNMCPGDLKHSEEFFFMDAGKILVDAAQKIIGFCNEAAEGDNGNGQEGGNSE